MLKNKSKILLPLLLIVFVAAGCGSSGLGQGGQASLKVWGVFDTNTNFAPMIAAYQQKNSNVRVEYTMKNVETYETDLLNALASGTGPDIFIIHNDWLPKYKDKMSEAPEKILSLKDYKNAYVDVVYNDLVSENKIYAVPFSVDSMALYYNKDILGSLGIATPPKTWEELRQQVIRISRPTNVGTFSRSGAALGTVSNINRAEDILYLMMLQNRTPLYTSDFSRATLDQSIRESDGSVFFPASDALNYYTTFADPSSDSYTWNERSNYSIDAFAAGQVAFLYGYSFTKEAILQKAPNLNFDVAPVPQPLSEDTLVNHANYWAYGVSKQSAAKDYAWDFLKNSASKDSLKAYNTLTDTPAARKELIAEQINDPELGVFANANLTAKSFYKKDAAKVNKIITDMINSVVLRGVDIRQALSTANQQINLVNQSK
jgi:multiple sugar transport system substrate-binding protein